MAEKRRNERVWKERGNDVIKWWIYIKGESEKYDVHGFSIYVRNNSIKSKTVFFIFIGYIGQDIVFAFSLFSLTLLN